jgi:hypothetical protein
MTRKRARGSRFQIWVAVPVTGVLTGTGLCVLVAHGLGEARHQAPDRAVEAGSPRSDGGDHTERDDARAILDALRVRPAPRPTLLRPAAAETPLAESRPLMVVTVLSSPVLSGSAPAVPAAVPPAVVPSASPPPTVAHPAGTGQPPPPTGGTTDPGTVDPPVSEPPVVDPPVVDPPVDPSPDDPSGSGQYPDPGTDPGTDPAPDPAPDPASDPEPAPDPASDPVPDPGTDPATDPAAEPAPADPVLEPSEPAPSGPAVEATV